MRILADENFPGEAVSALHQLGHDVARVRTEMPGSSDREVLERAQAEGRLVVTFDKDFGELAFRWRLPTLNGIILFRTRASSPARMTRIAVDALETGMDWAGHFSVVAEDRIRMTPLPNVDGGQL